MSEQNLVKEISEDERLLTLYSYEILDTPKESRFDDLVKTMTELLDVPYSKIAFIDRDRVWYKSALGLKISESPRDGSVYDLLIQSGGVPVIVTDIESDERRFKSVYKEMDPNVRSFALVPIIVQGKYLIGAVSVVDTKVREFEEKEIASLDRMARQVVELLEARREADALHDAIRNQQEEIRIKSTVERISKTLTAPVPNFEKLEVAVQSFTQAIINEFGWWASQTWFERSGQLIPSRWVFSSLAPRSFNELTKSSNAYSQAILKQTPILSPFHVEKVQMTNIENADWHPDKELLKKVGAREIICVDVTGATELAIRILFILPNQRSLTPRINTALSLSLSSLPQVIRRARTSEELNYRANHDELTGLLNRRGIDEQFPIKNYPDGSAADWTVIFLDLDKFKDVNDTYGHNVGDELLIEVANRIIQASRPVDSVARIGGDEFIMVAQGFESDNSIKNTTHRLLEQIGKPFTTSQGIELHPKVSIGVAYWDGISSLGTAINRSDEMMYKAKSEGGNRASLNNDRTSVLPAIDFDFDIKSKVKTWNIFRADNEEVTAIYFVTLVPNITAPTIMRELVDYLINFMNTDGADTRKLIVEISSITRSERANVFALFEALDKSLEVDKFFFVIDAAAISSEGINVARELKNETKCGFVISNFGTGTNELQLLSEFQPEFIKIDESETLPNTTVMKSAVAIANAFNIGLIAPVKYRSAFANHPSQHDLLYLIGEPRKGEHE